MGKVILLRVYNGWWLIWILHHTCIYFLSRYRYSYIFHFSFFFVSLFFFVPDPSCCLALCLFCGSHCAASVLFHFKFACQGMEKNGVGIQRNRMVVTRGAGGFAKVFRIYGCVSLVRGCLCFVGACTNFSRLACVFFSFIFAVDGLSLSSPLNYLFCLRLPS